MRISATTTAQFWKKPSEKTLIRSQRWDSGQSLPESPADNVTVRCPYTEFSATKTNVYNHEQYPDQTFSIEYLPGSDAEKKLQKFCERSSSERLYITGITTEHIYLSDSHLHSTSFDE